ncbi:MAG: hypothetical protein AB1486_01595 [Planctomycetota bacterium]
MAARVLGLLVVLLCALWSLWLRRQEADPDAGVETPQAPTTETPREADAFDAAAFERLAVPATSPMTQEEEGSLSSGSSLPYRLLGIIEEGGGLRAAVYDEEVGRLHLVSEGEALGHYRVAVQGDGVVLTQEGVFSSELRLRRADR